MRKLFISLFWTLNLIVALLLVGAYLSQFINPKHVSLFAFLGLSYPILLYVNMAFVVLWLFLKRKLMLLSLILILASYPLLHRYVQLFPVNYDDSRKALKVMSYNVRNFQQLGAKNKKSTGNSIASLIDKETPDIVCFQEFPKSKKLAKNFNLSLPSYGRGENIIYTLLRVAKQGIVINKDDNKFGVFADVIFGGDTIRVFSVQLLSYSVSDELKNYDTKERINRKRFIFSIAAKLNNGFTKRVSETEALSKIISESPYPVIVCGDFNDPPASYTYHKIISNKLNDAFVESGSGFGNTYLWTFPKVRIDYILTSDSFGLYDYNVVNTNFSDHLPISAVVQKINPSK